MRKVIIGALCALGVVLLFAFTTNDRPARHPTPPSGVTNPAVYVYDPHASGAIDGIPNVTGIAALGSSGAACTQTQSIGIYDDGGTTGVNCIDSFNGTQTNQANPPAAPTTNSATIFQYAVDSGFPAFTATIDSANGLLTPTGLYAVFTNYGTAANWDVECVTTQGWGTNTIVFYRSITTVGTTGSVNSDAFATTSLLTRSKMNTYSTGTGANATASIKNSGVQNFWRGNSAGAGGFLLWQRASIKTTVANTRWAFGAFNTTSALSGTSDPNVATDDVYFGCNVGDSNLSICSNDNSGTATCNTLGASFPCTTNGAWYDFWLYAAPGSSQISYAVQRLDTPATTAGVVTSDLPRNTVQMSWQFWTGNAATASSNVLGFFGMCFAANI
jgi:hypothetical protein